MEKSLANPIHTRLDSLQPNFLSLTEEQQLELIRAERRVRPVYNKGARIEILDDSTEGGGGPAEEALDGGLDVDS